MKKGAKVLAMLFLALVMVSTATGEIITVDDDGPADFNNIKAAIDYSKEGDTIIVAEGKYAKNINFLGKNITLTSINPTSPNIVDGTIIDGIVTFRGTEGPSCTLTGFNIDSHINGFDRLIDPKGENHTHATISYCIFENCFSYIEACDGTISNCLIANLIGLPVPWRVPKIMGCHGLIKNCTIVDIPDGIEVMEGGTCTIENSILYPRVWVFVNSGATLNISYCDLEAGLNRIRIWGSGTVNWGPGNIDTDPFFVRFPSGGLQDKGNYHLLQNSPCIDAGDPGYVPMPNETDLDGNPRIMGVAVDMGAYEFQRPCVLHVDADATGANNGTSWADAFNGLQDALAVAQSGDEIRVAQGIYKPDQGAGVTLGDREATFQLKDGVTIKGGYAGFGEPDPNARDFELYETILSGDLDGNDIEVNDPCDLQTEPTRSENSYHVVMGSWTDATAVLDGFTITGGNANGPILGWPFYDYRLRRGGGMYNESGDLTIMNCTFTENSAESFGAGMYNSLSCPRLSNCTFICNAGSGMVNMYSDAILSDCNFNNNDGSGMRSWSSSPTLTNCTFSGNSIRGMDNREGGSPSLTNCTFISNNHGGMSNWENSPTVTNCTFSGNSAYYGGGMYNHNSSLRMTNCIFTGNSAKYEGGGICDFTGVPPPVAPPMGLSKLSSNNGMAISGNWDVTLTNCTFAANTAPNGNALAFDSIWQSFPRDVQIANCILWDGGDEIWYNDVSTKTITYSNVQGNWAGKGNIDADPLFVEPGYWDSNGVWIEGDYHLLPDSPCIDSGDPDYVAGPNETDLDGKPRVIGGRIDMGAYEFLNTRPVADAGHNQLVECACNTNEGTKVALDGTGSYDSDGDLLTYTWTGPFVESPAQGATLTVTLEDGCPGGYVITLVVNDGTEDSEPNDVMITVVDTTPPEFALSVNPTTLWPPNKKMVKITPSWTLSDNCDAMPGVSLVSISINESKTKGNGRTDDDVKIGDDGSIYLRAERSGAGKDRVYTITYRAVDDCENATVRSATVTVPHDRR